MAIINGLEDFFGRIERDANSDICKQGNRIPAIAKTVKRIVSALRVHTSGMSLREAWAPVLAYNLGLYHGSLRRATTAAVNRHGSAKDRAALKLKVLDELDALCQEQLGRHSARIVIADQYGYDAKTIERWDKARTPQQS